MHPAEWPEAAWDSKLGEAATRHDHHGIASKMPKSLDDRRTKGIARRQVFGRDVLKTK